MYAEVEESEDQIAELLVAFDGEEFGASYPDPRGYYVDFTTTSSFNPFGEEIRFTSYTTTIDSFTFQRAGETRVEFNDYVQQLLVQLQLLYFILH